MSAQDRGSQLEQEVAEFYRRNGYVAETNLRLVGRSGATHEVDVVAEKSDGVSTFRVGIEYKAWSRPIDKDVVAKAAFVFDDLSIGNRVVIAPGGATESARAAGQAQNVDIWDAAVIGTKLRAANLTPVASDGQLFVVPTYLPERATADWHRERREGIEARLREGERLLVTSRLWVPTLMLLFRFGIETGDYFKERASLRVRTSFDGIAGAWSELIPEEADLDAGHEVPLADAVVPSGYGAEDVIREIGPLLTLPSEEVELNGRRFILDTFGLSLWECEITSWECVGSFVMHTDAYVGIAERNGREVVHALHGHNGRRWSEIENLLSDNTWSLRELPGFGVPALAPVSPAPQSQPLPPSSAHKGSRHASPY